MTPSSAPGCLLLNKRLPPARKPKQNRVLYRSSFKKKGKNWEEWKIVSDRNGDKKPRKDCEIPSFWRAPQNQHCLQLITPLLGLAVASSASNQLDAISTANLWLLHGELCGKLQYGWDLLVLIYKLKTQPRRGMCVRIRNESKCYGKPKRRSRGVMSELKGSQWKKKTELVVSCPKFRKPIREQIKAWQCFPWAWRTAGPDSSS